MPKLRVALEGHRTAVAEVGTRGLDAIVKPAPSCVGELVRGSIPAAALPRSVALATLTLPVPLTLAIPLALTLGIALALGIALTALRRGWSLLLWRRTVLLCVERKGWRAECDSQTKSRDQKRRSPASYETSRLHTSSLAAEQVIARL